uniref:Uncharacterized protein n=1 Tax=Coccidioides posadasii RMSCC 3488 TaxID=454284 RepID=A0A0J6FT11_COCPO|nr:hypothetical protein CPAG_08516 [Coccidioides posadasii RMSCC 3488]
MASPAWGTRCKESKRLSDFFNIYALLDITARFVDNLRTHILLANGVVFVIPTPYQLILRRGWFLYRAGPPRSFFGDILDKVHLILIEDTGNCQPTFSTQLGFGILGGFADYLFALVRHIVPGEEHLNKPTIRHPELSPSTIFVSESEISALSLNLEQTAILPFCVQADIYSAFRTTVTRVRRMSFVQLSPMTLTC